MAVNADAILQEISPALRPLTDKGFRVAVEHVSEGPFYLLVPVRGRHWTIAFNIDVRDKVVDCYLSNMAVNNGRQESLVRYLIDRCGVRGFGGGKSPAGFDPAQGVSDCIGLLEKHAPWVTGDLPGESV